MGVEGDMTSIKSPPHDRDLVSQIDESKSAQMVGHEEFKYEESRMYASQSVT